MACNFMQKNEKSGRILFVAWNTEHHYCIDSRIDPSVFMREGDYRGREAAKYILEELMIALRWAGFTTTRFIPLPAA
jgi:hypothetical protein